MSIIFRAMKGVAAIVVAAALLLVLPAAADAQSTGSVRFRVVSGGFILGGCGGIGTLNFRRKTYPLRVGGLGVGTHRRVGGGLRRHRVQFTQPRGISSAPIRWPAPA